MKNYNVTVQDVLDEQKSYFKGCEDHYKNIKSLSEIKDEKDLDIHSPEFLRQT